MKFRKLAEVFVGRLGIRAMTASWGTSDSIAMLDSQDAQNRYAAWVSTLPPGQFEQPAQQWDEGLLGQRIGWQASIVMSSFASSLEASVRAASCLYHRMHAADQMLWVIGAGCHGAKKDLDREEFSLVFRREGATTHSLDKGAPEAAFQLGALAGQEMLASQNDPHKGISSSAIIAPLSTSLAPREKLRPVWEDSAFCVNLVKQFLSVPGVDKSDWDEAIKNAAFALVVCEHASSSNSETLNQKGTLSAQSPNASAGLPAAQERVVYSLELQRSEVPNVLSTRSTRRQRP